MGLFDALFGAIKDKRDWDDLENLKRENAEGERQIREAQKRIADNQKKNPRYYDGMRDDEH